MDDIVDRECENTGYKHSHTECGVTGRYKITVVSVPRRENPPLFNVVVCASTITEATILNNKMYTNLEV